LNIKLLVYTSMIAIAVVTAAACGGDNDGAEDSPTATTATTPRPTAPDRFPADYPEEFPSYPGASLDQGARYEGQVLVLFSSPDARDDIADFYREKLQEEPWELLTERISDNGNTLVMTFRHSSENVRGSVTLSVGSSPGAGTTINAVFTVPTAVEATLPPTTPDTTADVADS
jgi:hypothetical protein